MHKKEEKHAARIEIHQPQNAERAHSIYLTAVPVVATTTTTTTIHTLNASVAGGGLGANKRAVV